MSRDDIPEDATRIAGASSPPRAAGQPDASRPSGQGAHGEVTTLAYRSASFSASGESEGAALADASGASVLPAGARLGEFEIRALIGQGGFGAVYLAWDPALERTVAIKEYLPASLSSRRSNGNVVPLSERLRDTFELGMRSFINEARLLAQFDHPSLLKVYRFWQERGTAYMAMPCYRGPTLRQALADMHGGASEDWLLPVIDGLAQALAVMHEANCYHRDVAPDNIIVLEDSGRPVLLDFGAARRVITDKTQTITVILKPGYAPIEQYGEVPNMTQGPWTDVYALAAVMHVAVTGRAPPPSVGRLLSDSYAPLARNQLLASRYSPRLLAAIDIGLAVRPEGRPQSMTALRAALGLDVARTAPSASVPAAASQATRLLARPTPAPRRRALGAVAGLCALAALGGGGWWWLRRGDALAQFVAAVPAPAAPVELPATPVQPTAQPSAAPPAAAPVEPTAQPAVAPPAAVPVQPTAQPAAAPPVGSPRTPRESMAALADAAAPGWQVSATPRSSAVRIGHDNLNFELRSNRAGHVYVLLLSSGDDELYLLFPNQIDKDNRIAAGNSMTLPRPGWPMQAGGPPGIDHFAVIVSAQERDFSDSGAQSDGVFVRFSLPVLAALETVRGNSPPPLLGRAVCTSGAACEDACGVAHFEITEQA